LALGEFAVGGNAHYKIPVAAGLGFKMFFSDTRRASAGYFMSEYRILANINVWQNEIRWIDHNSNGLPRR